MAALFASHAAFAGVSVENSNGKLLGFAAKVLCGSGITCSISGAKVSMSIGTGVFTPVGGIQGLNTASGAYATIAPFPVNATSSGGTSTTPSATTVYLTQVFVPENTTLTGLAVNNAGTCGTNNYVVALFNASGVAVASSASAGVLCSGTNAWQKIAFATPTAVIGPGIYFAGVYMNGTTDRFYTIPQAGEYVGGAGTVTGQTFGTVSSVAVPTSFTANAGAIVHTY